MRRKWLVADIDVAAQDAPDHDRIVPHGSLQGNVRAGWVTLTGESATTSSAHSNGFGAWSGWWARRLW